MVYVDVNELSSRFLSRERGHEAAEKLEDDYVDVERICINLDASDVVSLSFLDGLILALNQKNMLTKVVFNTQKSDVLGKLSCIAGAREVAIYDASLTKITPMLPKEEKLSFVKNKALLNV